MGDGIMVALILYFARFFGILIDTRAIIYSVVAVIIVEGLIYHAYLKRLVTMDSMGPRFGHRE